MTLSDFERKDARGQILQIAVITIESFDLERPASAWYHKWGGAYFISRRPTTPSSS